MLGIMALTLLGGCAAAPGGGSVAPESGATGVDATPTTSSSTMNQCGNPEPVNDGDDRSPELEALMPSSVDGQALEVYSTDYSKTDLYTIEAGLSDEHAVFSDFILSTGKSLCDVMLVNASVTSEPDGCSTIRSIRVDGVPGAQMLEKFSEDPGSSWGYGDLYADSFSLVSIGGKKVYEFLNPGLSFALYHWVTGDVLFTAELCLETFPDPGAVISSFD
jgi:hypothetical protein